MDHKRLTKGQREALLAWISEGLQPAEINERAAQARPPFAVSRQQVDHYRKATAVKVRDIAEASESDALKSGFALKEKRVAALNALAEAMFADLTESGRLWIADVKAVGSGESAALVDFETFNSGEVQQLRATLDDIAKEVGDRRHKVEHTGKDGGGLQIVVEYAASQIDPHGSPPGAG